MTRQGRTRVTDRAQAARYRDQARAFLKDARSLVDGGQTPSGNTVAVLVVHGVIAWTDALCIAFGGRKSIGDHAAAPELLEDILGQLADASRIAALRAIIGRKDKVSYTGTAFSLTEAATLLKKAEQYAEWAETLYQRRPAPR
jgi:hypothetical protein